jgi:hypothetical protein
MLDGLASGQSGTRMKKTNDAGTGPVPDYLTQSGIFFVRYRNKIMDPGLPMLVSLMPMPSCDYLFLSETLSWEHWRFL